jgi:hypothetical protein
MAFKEAEAKQAGDKRNKAICPTSMASNPAKELAQRRHAQRLKARSKRGVLPRHEHGRCSHED